MSIRSGVRVVLAVAVVAVVAVAPGSAHAQFVVSPYLHMNFGDVEARRGGFGGFIGYYGRRLGVEIDIDQHNHFYKDKDLEGIPNPCIPGVRGMCIDNDTDAWIFNGNVLAFIPIPHTTRWRPYVTGGAGLIYAWVHDAGPYNSDQTNFALNLGAGVTCWLSSWFALRADVRYFHAFVDHDALDGGYASDYDFVRFNLGVTFAIPRT